MDETQSLFKSQEVRRSNIFYYPFNAYTSLFYLMPIIPLFKKIQVFELIGIIILVILTIFSLLWWGIRDKQTQIIDIVSYSSLIMYIGFYYLYKKSSIDKNNLIGIFLFLMILVLSITVVEKVYMRIINVLSVIFSLLVFIHYFESNTELLGIALIIISLILKIGDSLALIDYNKLKLISGTGWFHILSAIGVYFIFDTLSS